MLKAQSSDTKQYHNILEYLVEAKVIKYRWYSRVYSSKSLPARGCYIRGIYRYIRIGLGLWPQGSVAYDWTTRTPIEIGNNPENIKKTRKTVTGVFAVKSSPYQKTVHIHAHHSSMEPYPL